jgi:hypothetical protein
MTKREEEPNSADQKTENSERLKQIAEDLIKKGCDPVEAWTLAIGMLTEIKRAEEDETTPPP